MYSSNSAQLIQNILSNPTLANECVDYLQNIKPKLAQLLNKIPILDELENKLNNKSNSKDDVKNSNETNELLIKLKSKYDNLKKEYNKLESESRSCIECLNKDKLIFENSTNKQCEECNKKNNIITQFTLDMNKSCEECDKKNNIITQFTSHLNKPCPSCEEKDRQIHKLFQKNDKICKEKDNQINELKSKCQILEKQAIDSANELARLQDKSNSLESTKQNIISEQKVDIIIPSEKLDNPEQNLNTNNRANYIASNFLATDNLIF